MSATSDEKKRVIIAGGGFAGLTAALALARRLRGRQRKEVEILLVDPNQEHLLRPKLPEAMGGRIPCAVHIPFASVIPDDSIRFVQGSVERIDPRRKILAVRGEEYPFWRLVIATGSVPDFSAFPEEASEWLISTWDFGSACNLRRKTEMLVQMAKRPNLPREKRRAMLQFLIIGGGFVGVEVAAELSQRLRRMLAGSEILGDVKVVLVESSSELLPRLRPAARRKAAQRLRSLGVELLLGRRVIQVERKGVQLSDGTFLEAGTILWAGGVKSVPLLVEGLVSDEERRGGKLEVQNDLSLPFAPQIYAAGDIARQANAPARTQEPSAHRAIRHGLLVAENLYRDLNGRKRKTLRPEPPIYNLGLSRGYGLLDGLLPWVISGFMPAVGKQVVILRHLWFVGGWLLVRQSFAQVVLSAWSARRWDTPPCEGGVALLRPEVPHHQENL